MTDATYPQLETLTKDEIFVEGVQVGKGKDIRIITIEKVILKNALCEMRKALKSQLNADNVYLIILEK